MPNIRDTILAAAVIPVGDLLRRRGEREGNRAATVKTTMAAMPFKLRSSISGTKLGAKEERERIEDKKYFIGK